MSAKLFLLVGLTMLGMEVRAHANLLTNGSFENAGTANTAAVITAGGTIPESLSGSQALTSGLNGEIASAVQSQMLATSNGPGFAASETSGSSTTSAMSTTSGSEESPFGSLTPGVATGSLGIAPKDMSGVVSVETVPEFSHWAVFAGFGLLVVGFRRGRTLLGALRA